MSEQQLVARGNPQLTLFRYSSHLPIKICCAGKCFHQYVCEESHRGEALSRKYLNAKCCPSTRNTASVRTRTTFRPLLTLQTVREYRYAVDRFLNVYRGFEFIGELCNALYLLDLSDTSRIRFLGM